MTMSQYRKLGKAGDHELRTRILRNLEVLRKHVQLCGDRGWNYRVSSNLFPLLTHPEMSDMGLCSDPLVLECLERAKRDAANNGVRLSCHPDQFNVLGSTDAAKVTNTVRELDFQAWVMDQLTGLPTHYNPINLHVNASKGNLCEIAARFKGGLYRCTESVQKRLVLEVEEQGPWSVRNLFDYFDLPLTFDNLHHASNPDGIEEAAASRRCASTWGSMRPLFHYSESAAGAKRSHADLPSFKLPKFYNQVDYDVELKQKDRAIECLCKNS